MLRLLLAVLLTATACDAQQIPAGPIHPNLDGQAVPTNAPQQPQIVVPAGTTVPVAITQAVWAKSAKAGDRVYAETVFPIAVNGQMAIPAGTYVQGQIDSLTRPRLFSPHAQFQIHFTQLVFANGYVAAFGKPAISPSGTQSAQPNDVLPAVSDPYVDVSSASDILLDNGTQMEMALQLPVVLDGGRVADAVRSSNPLQPTAFKSATLCRPTAGTPGTPGTPDTVIPGTPGTPDTVIPGAPGQPDIVIPGTPATPDTVIPGTPGTAGTAGTSCPGPPVVASNPKAQNYKESFQLSVAANVAGTQLSAGSYQADLAGSGLAVQVVIRQNGKGIATAPARFVILNGRAPANLASTHTNSDGSLSLQSLRFAGEPFALYFDGSLGN